jgi:hypothetical protein
MTPAEFGRSIADGAEKRSKIIKLSAIKPD